MTMLPIQIDDHTWKHLSVTVELHEVVGTRVLWINRDWFKGQGIDVSQAQVREQLDAWLLASFSYIVREPDHGAELFTGKVRPAYADRYGGRGLGHAGGSGRCVYIDGFYLKGVGPTPLIDPKGPFFKTHGALPLQEAIREAILSQIACAEFPWGGVPTLAILGLRPRFHNGEHDARGEHRALMLRPAFHRLGHLEPAKSFVALKGAVHAQADEARLDFSLRAWSKGQLGGGRATNSLATIAERLGEQLAFGRVHRLSNVSYISSNFSTEGALADFGSFRSFPNWEAAFTARGMPPFGQEIPAFTRTIIWALAYQLQRASERIDDMAAPSVVAVVAAFQAAFDRTVAAETAALFGVPPDSALAGELREACNDYFAAQNRVLRDYHVPAEREASVAWLFDDLAASGAPATPAGKEDEDGAARAQLAQRIRHILERTSHAEHARLTIRRTLAPRPGIYRERLHAWVWDHLVISREQSWLAEHLEEAIRARVSASRRLWRGVDAAFAIRGHALDIDGNSILWLYDPVTGTNTLRLSLVFVDGQAEFFGQRCSAPSALGLPQATRGRICTEVRGPDGYDGAQPLSGLAGVGLTLPRMSTIY